VRGINHVLIGGNIGRDPEVKYMQGGSMIATFSLAISEKRKKADGEYAEKTNWINVVCFGANAEIVQKHLGKGDEIFVDGRISVREWEDKEGNKKRVWEVIAREINFIRLKKREDDSSNDTTTNDSEVPF
jgi:single-strand DNA-binding protein